MLHPQPHSTSAVFRRRNNKPNQIHKAVAESVTLLNMATMTVCSVQELMLCNF